MITIACCLWDANEHSLPFSRHYSEADVEKLYRGFARNLNMPFRFVCWSERERQYGEPIKQRRLTAATPHYGSFNEPLSMNEPMILAGLDTIVVGNCDHLAAYCIGGDRLAVPRDPIFPEKVCNGVVLAPAGSAWVWENMPKQENDMEWMRSVWRAGGADVIDDLFPGQVVSYKGEIAKRGLGDDTRIVYFHGRAKPHELPHVGWIARHWHDNVKEAA